MTQGAVVGEQNQTGHVLVQPPHRKHPPAAQFLRQQVQYRPLPGVLGGGDHPRTFVEHDVQKALPERDAVHRKDRRAR